MTRRDQHPQPAAPAHEPPGWESDRPYVVVVGGANMDLKATSTAPVLPGTSNPGTATVTPGGVGRNVAENLARLGTPVHLVAAVGHDFFGDALITTTQAAGVAVGLVRRGPDPTGTYTAVLDDSGELVVAVADMTGTDAISGADVEAAGELIAGAALLVLDANLAPATLAAVLDLAARASVPVVVDPVSAPKAARMSPVLTATRPVFAVTPNLTELAALTGAPVGTPEDILAATGGLHARGVRHVWVRLGSQGSLLSTAGEVPIPVPTSGVAAVDVTGAGDAMLAAFCHALLEGRAPADAAAFGQAAAELTVTVRGTVRPDLSATLVNQLLSERTR